jgi:hypothetical protein
MVLDNNSETRSIYWMPWAFEDGMLWVSGQTDTYFDMQQRIYYNTMNLLQQINIIISPVGWAFNTVMKDRPDIKLFSNDYNHQSKKGSYLTACVLYVTIFKESLNNIPYYSGLPEDEVIYFQSVASGIVLNDLVLWNITPVTTGIDN